MLSGPARPEIARPVVVCLCGPARFWRQFRASYLEETLAGRIVLSIAAVPGGDEALFASLSPAERARVTEMLGACTGTR